MDQSSNWNSALADYAERARRAEVDQKMQERNMQRKVAAQIETQLFELGLLCKENGDCIKWECNPYTDKEVPRVVLNKKADDAKLIG